MKRKPAFSPSPALVTVVAVLPATLRAIEPSDVLVFSKDPVSIRPQLSLSEMYNDNIFYQSKGEEDFITTITPGIDIRVGRPEGNHLFLDYRFNKHFYADRSDLNSGEHLVGLRNRFQSRRFALSGTDQIQFLSSPVGLVEEFRGDQPTPAPTPGGELPVGSQAPLPSPAVDTATPVRGAEVITAEARNIDRTIHYHTYSLGYQTTEKTSAYLQGLYSETDYEEDIRLYDLDTFRAIGGFTFHALPKTSFFGEVYYGQTTTTPNFPAPSNPRSDFVGGFLGARGQFTPKLSGVAKVGYEARWFSDDSDAPSSPVADLSLNYRFSDKTSVSLSYARIHDVSVQFARESYTANIVSGRLDQTLGTTGKWFASIGGSYGLYDYETLDDSTDRGYDRYSVNFSLAYRLQEWLSASLGYNFDSTSSDEGGVSEYDVNRVTLSFEIGY